MTDVTNQGGEPIEFIDDAADGVADDQATDQVNDQAEGDDQSGNEGEDADGTEGDDEGSQDDELEDFEENGRTYKVPKDLKGHLLRNQDYTRKTQDLAEQRKAFEARVSGFDAAAQAVDKGRLELAKVNERLEALRELTPDDWREIDRMDRANGTRKYDELQRELTALPNQAAAITKTLEAEGQKAAEAQRELTVKRQGDAEAILQRDISGWGPEVGAKLADFIQSKYGVSTADAGTAKFDAALVKMAHAASQWDAHQQKQATQKKAQDVTKHTPPQTAKKGAPPARLEELSAAEFAKRRNAQLAKRYQ